jgi:hypothetical protein
MNIERVSIKSDAAIPLMAALPYRVTLSPLPTADIAYDPAAQLTRFTAGNYSTCREDESVNPIFGRSKADTQKDD